MAFSARKAALGTIVAAHLAACGGSSSDLLNDEPLNTDYSSLQVAQSHEGLLVAPNNGEQLLRPIRNGLRLSVRSSDYLIATTGLPTASAVNVYSATTVQVDGVDEADPVKYDGHHIFSMRQEYVEQSAGGLSVTRNVLKIFRTHPESAGTEVVSEFVLDGEQSTRPLIYQLQSEQGAARYIAAVSQDYRGWFMPSQVPQTLVIWPDHTTLQLLDVSDPARVSQVWKFEMEGWLKASRKIGDTLYLVSNYRPRLSGLITPADTTADREANERRIRSAAAAELLPTYRVNDSAERPLVTPADCVISQDLQDNEAYKDLLVVTALNLSRRQVTDVSCMSTDFNSVYVSTQSLYVAGSTHVPSGQPGKTALHKFALEAGNIGYRASGAVTGEIGWNNPSYYMDEYEGDLRVLTTRSTFSTLTHQISVLREASAGNLQLVSTLPNDAHPEPIGKPDERVWAVRFFAERAYIVTARVVDPLYVVDLSDPADPVLTGQLEIPGVSTYLQPLAMAGSQSLLSVGREIDATGRAGAVKVELFDVRDVGNPRSLGVQLLGAPASSTDAFSDPHAITFLSMPGETSVHRMAMSVDVFGASSGGNTAWSYSGLHLLEVRGVERESPQLHFQGVIKTAEAGSMPYSAVPVRGVLHDESVFAVAGDRVVSSLWENVHGE